MTLCEDKHFLWLQLNRQAAFQVLTKLESKAPTRELIHVISDTWPIPDFMHNNLSLNLQPFHHLNFIFANQSWMMKQLILCLIVH